MPRSFQLFFASLLSVFFLAPSLAQAVAIGPTVFDFSADPGHSVEATLTIRNDEALPRSYFLQIQKFVPKGEYGQQEFLPLSDTSGLPSWMYLSMPAVTLNPGQSINVPFSVRLPQEATPGSYYAALFVSGQAEGPGANSGTGLTARVGALVFLTVQGSVTERLSLTDFQRTSDGMLSHLPVGFAIGLRNEGNAHVTPEGSVEIRNLLGGRVHAVPMNGQRGKVLPASSRRLVAEWAKASPREGSGFVREVREEWSNFAFGLYRAELKLTTRGVTGDAPTLYFWVLPWRLLVLGLLVLLVLGFGFNAGRKWWLMRQL